MAEITAEKKYILIVEDDQSYGRVFQRKLEHEGFETCWACDGEEGLNKIMERAPDLVILDLMMPKMTGYQVLAALKEKGLLNKLKVVVATNLSQHIDQDKVKEAGAIDYFVKSDLSILEMVEKVRKIIEM